MGLEIYKFVHLTFIDTESSSSTNLSWAYRGSMTLSYQRGGSGGPDLHFGKCKFRIKVPDKFKAGERKILKVILIN